MPTETAGIYSKEELKHAISRVLLVAGFESISCLLRELANCEGDSITVKLCEIGE